MGKQTTVLIYQVDSAGVTGVQVGEGSLVEPRLILVHPPLSYALADDHGPDRLRVGIRSEAERSPAVEVIDGRESPKVIGRTASDLPLVGLELRTAAASPFDVMNGFSRVNSRDELVNLAVPLLEAGGVKGWNDDPDDPGDSRNVFCRLCGWPC
jgi:hypothetical protein